MIFKTQEKGQAIVLIVLAIVGLVAITALAVDGGNVFADRRKAQSAADNAALAGAYARVKSQNITNAALVITSANNRPAETVTVKNPPGTGCNNVVSPQAGNIDFVQVIIQSQVPTYFGPVIGINSLKHCVEATARSKPAKPGSAFPGETIVALNCDDSRSFNAHGNAILKLTGGGIYVNSDDPLAAFYAGGTPQVWSPNYHVVGGTDGNGNIFTEDGSGPGVVTSDMIPYECPTHFYTITAPTCAVNAKKSTDATGPYAGYTRWSPGSIRGTFLKGNTVLDDGIYCIEGDVKWVNDEKFIAPHVLLYFINGGMDMAGTAHFELGPSLDVNYKNLLVYAPINNAAQFKWNGDSLSEFTGAIWVPGSDFVLLGTGEQDGMDAQIVADTVEWGGTSEGNIKYLGAGCDVNFCPIINPQIELIK